jgi:nucleoside-diphosphate-sugar epimerase
VLGWEARIGVREGIAQTVAWLRQHDIAPLPAA